MYVFNKPFFSKNRFVVDASRYKLFDYRGHSGQSKLQILESDLLRVIRKLDATFNTPVGSRYGSSLRLRAMRKRTVISKHQRLL